MNNQTEGNLSERIGRLEEKYKGTNRRVDTLEDGYKEVSKENRELSRLTTLLEEQMKDSKEKDERQFKQMDKFADALTNIDTNLTNLNRNQEQTQQRVSKLEDTIDKNKISPAAIGKIIIVGIVLGVIGYVLKVTTGIDFKL